LQPRAVTRDLDWGVKVPLPGTENKVLYVWFDAPIGYISATREWGKQTGNDWEKWWKDKETRLVHFIGKDNIVFHCIIFPSMLKEEGTFILPDNVPAFEFMNLEGDKISTSNNWAVWLHEYLQEFPGKQDVLRYVLTTNAPETKDNDFTWKDFQARNNNELLAIFGNFVNRTVVLTHKYFNGKVPAKVELTAADKEAIDGIKAFPKRIGDSLDNFRFREALSEMMNLARLGNKYLTDAEPWKLIKTDPERVKTILNISLEICANLAILSEPFLPLTAAKLSQMMNLPVRKWAEAGNPELLEPGHEIGKAEYLFEKIEDSVVEAQIKKLMDTKKKNIETREEPEVKLNPLKETIVYDDFMKLDIRVCTIEAAEKVEKTDKLLKLTVNTGLDTRTIVSGIAEYYKPEDLIGKQYCFILNLEPRKIRGIASNGMILSGENPDGGLSLIGPGGKMENGSEVK
jgi:methionyl-tRNA synthetase